MEHSALKTELVRARDLLAGTGYVAERVLGKGGFGLVVLAKLMDYPHIVRMHEVFNAGASHVGIAMEYCAGGNLLHYLTRHHPSRADEKPGSLKRVPWEAQARWFFQQLVLALE
ncbi:hypothetical protein V8C86DRAFT_3148278 [Haematococcus lacustris]